MTITQLTTNPPAAADSFSIPAEIREAFTKNKLAINELPLGWRGREPASELAPNIVKIPAGWDVALVRQDDGVIIIEAPISAKYAAQVIAEAERRFPGVPIKAVISTSDAWPHVAGIREHAAREIPIYALDLNQKLLERVLASSHRNHPDSLARRPRAPRFHAVANKTVVGAGKNRLEIYPIRGEGSERMLMVYFPEHGLLYGSDLIQQYPDGSFFMPQYLSELVAAVRENKLVVQTVFAMHARAMPWNDIVAAVEQAMADAPQAGTAN